MFEGFYPDLLGEGNSDQDYGINTIELVTENINENMTFLVRQLPPSENGLPIEIYVFSNDNEWINYENIQSDIFDHLIAATNYFDLRIFQNPSGHDLNSLVKD